MALINFPTSPSLNDEYTFEGRTWLWNGSGWEIKSYVAEPGATGATGPVGATGVQGPVGSTGPTGVQGPVGATGATGVVGVTGATGVQGPVGVTGATGVQGPQGATGATGVQGLVGVTGATGVQGPVGVTGATGVQGPVGATGATGVQGVVGVTGATGVVGVTGATGVTGDKGGVRYAFSTTVTDADPGNGIIRYNNATIASVTQVFIDNVDGAGVSQASWYDTWDDSTTSANRGYLVVNGNLAGSQVVNIFRITGAVTAAAGYYKIPVAYVSGVLPANATELVISFSRTGDVGVTGATGVVGVTGATGAQGPIGVTGATGVQGPVGVTGATGVQGPQGATGATGVQGVVGVTGATGVQGPQGATGATGVQGIQGATGPTGIQGVVGVTGATGVQGPTGIQGATGPIGVTGATGVQGSTGPIGATGATGPVGATGPSIGVTTSALTFSNAGSGAASGTTFDGSVARTISYNSIGAPSTTGTNASGTWGISVTGSAAQLNGISSTGLFNNMGETHNARLSFDATAASYDYGLRFVQGSTNGPGTGGSQFYSAYVGLGSQYPATGAGSYGMYVAIDRNTSSPYLSVRYNEGNTLTSWYRICAGKADTLTTARTINGTSFNGSANITTANWGTSRTLTIGSTGKAVDGSGNVSWSLTEIGAVSSTGASTFADLTSSSGIESLKVGGFSSSYKSVPATGVSFAAMPMGAEIWHDLFAFLRYYTVTHETYDGATWSAGAVNKELFAQKENQTIEVINATTVTAARWTFTGVAYGSAQWVVIGHAWNAGGAPSKTVTVESSPDGGTTWNSIHSSTYTDHANAVFHRLDPYYGDNTLRITIQWNSGGSVRLSNIKLLTARPGDQGRGKEAQLPFTWNGDQDITTGRNLTITGTATGQTEAVGTNNTRLATTAFVNAEIANDAPTKTGGGASGTWGISITGNAATATTVDDGTF